MKGFVSWTYNTYQYMRYAGQWHACFQSIKLFHRVRIWNLFFFQITSINPGQIEMRHATPAGFGTICWSLWYIMIWIDIQYIYKICNVFQRLSIATLPYAQACCSHWIPVFRRPIILIGVRCSRSERGAVLHGSTSGWARWLCWIQRYAQIL